ncbi:MAG: hypothetical protein WB816_14795 [Methylocystis sp.]
MSTMRAVILAFAASLLTSGARAGDWRVYHNDRFGVTADAPADWITDPPPANNDGQVFVSPDKRARLTISGILVISPREEDFASLLAPNDGETVTYKKRGSASVIVSGIKGDRIFYRKSILSCRGGIWNDI